MEVQTLPGALVIGTLPAPAQHVLSAVLARMAPGPLYVGTSGNATVERLAWSAGWRDLHGNDVSLYSVALGRHLCGERLDVKVKDPQWSWLEGYIATSADLVAALAVLSRLGEFTAANAWARRMFAAHLAAFDQHWRKTRDRVERETAEIRLRSFYEGDVVEFALSLSPEAMFASYPPTFKSGYEKLYRFVDSLFSWDAPTYPIFDEHRLEVLVESLAGRQRWLLGWKDRLPGLRPIAKIQPTPRSMPFWLHGSEEVAYYAGPRTKTAPLLLPRLGPTEPAEPPLELVEITGPQLAGMRSLYLNPSIVPSGPQLCLAVLANRKVIGVLGFTWMVPGSDVGLLSDFAVRPTVERRLAKLVAACALSAEARLLVERHAARRITGVRTAVYTQRSVSMKYRDAWELVRRKPGELTYRGEAARWTLEELWQWWEKKR